VVGRKYGIMIVYIKKDGIYYRQFNKETKEESFSNIESHMAYYLQDIVSIDEDVTVEDLMNVLMQYEEQVDVLFMGHTRGFKLKPFFDNMNEEAPEGVGITDLDFIEFHWETDYTVYDKEVDGEDAGSNFHCGVGFSGIDDSVKENTTEKSRYYSMSLSPLNRWKELPMKINNEFIIEQFEKNSETGVYERKVIMDSERDMTLYELIGGFLHEISWHGYPEDKEEVVSSLNESIEAVESGEAELIPWEKVQIDMKTEQIEELKKEKEQLIAEERYEEVKEIDDAISNIESKIEELERELNSREEDEA
jgi:hypothetical protein